ncbi:antibiotic biosynthesis monooxygenase family protein [Halovivax limisalsi]|uniref:antibiotic biosynthesis monooxygenase family protein n=1 Tax=Halovivax limisalsi TaxID=1453760 RepID=UPI001FFD14F7|nr:antibiotic biosynthesis monooxygenase [Halovivax limisalsi]
MIVVSNRVQVPADRVDAFVDRLRTNHGIEERAGFRELRLLAPVDAEGYVTQTVWESREAYESWRDSVDFDRAHGDADAESAFEAPNEVEIHEVVAERGPAEPANASTDG